MSKGFYFIAYAAKVILNSQIIKDLFKFHILPFNVNIILPYILYVIYEFYY